MIKVSHMPFGRQQPFHQFVMAIGRFIGEIVFHFASGWYATNDAQVGATQQHIGRRWQRRFDSLRREMP